MTKGFCNENRTEGQKVSEESCKIKDRRVKKKKKKQKNGYHG